MEELLPGVFHWTAYHERIGQRVHSYLAAEAAALIDPMLPDEGLEWFAQRRPAHILLTNRHHLRHSARFVDAFGCDVFCHEEGLHEFGGDDPEVRGVRPGDEPAPGIVVCEVRAICPDEVALHLTAAGALACADGVIRRGDGGLDFVSDRLLGDDPEGVKRGLRVAYGRLARELEFDALLLAHGEPLAEGGRAALAQFARGA